MVSDARSICRYLTLVCAGFLAVAANGCSDGGRRNTGGTIVFGIENDLTNLDPIKSQEPYSLRVIGQIFDGLVTLNAKNELEPALAESWTHNDAYDTWTFRLRPHARFHRDSVFGASGTREVRAQDVVESFQRIVSKDSYPAFVLADALQGVAEFQKGAAKGVAGLREVDSLTVEMKLQRPEPSFLHRLTSPWFVVFPREAVALGPDVFGRTKVIGTGPFKLSSRQDNEVVLIRNDDYWQPHKGTPDTVIFRVIKNEQIRASELRNGRISLMMLPAALIPAVLARIAANGAYDLRPPYGEHFSVQGFPTFNSHFIGFNCDRMDAHLRRAISLAINREEVLRVIAQGVGMVTPGTVPPGLLGYVPPYANDIFDPVHAREELRMSRFNPLRDSVELLVHEKDNTEQLGQLIQAQLSRVGIPLAIRKQDYNTVVGRMISGQTQAFALALEYVFSAPEPILNNIFNSEKIPVPNFWRYRNPRVDQEFAQLRGIGDRSRANMLASQIEKQIIDDAPAAFLYQERGLVIYNKNLSDVAINGHSIPLLREVRISQ